MEARLVSAAIKGFLIGLAIGIYMGMLVTCIVVSGDERD